MCHIHQAFMAHFVRIFSSAHIEEEKKHYSVPQTDLVQMLFIWPKQDEFVSL